MATLKNLRGLRRILLALRRYYLSWRHGLVIDPSAQVSLSARFIPAGAGSIVIGANTLIAFRTLTLARKGETTRVGANCFVGGGAMIHAGVEIGDNSIIGAGAVVTEDIPPRSLVIGNPGKIIRTGLDTGAYGRLPEADANTLRLYHSIEPTDD